METKLHILVIATLGAMAACAIPQAPLITYGMVRDEYGNPLEFGGQAFDAAAIAAFKPGDDADGDGIRVSRGRRDEHARALAALEGVGAPRTGPLWYNRRHGEIRTRQGTG